MPTSPANRSAPICSRGDGRGRAWLRWTPSSSRQRSSGATESPRSIESTVSATSEWTVTRSRSWISMITSKVGGALRSRTLFCVRRRRASSSPRVTLWIPPIRSRQRRVEHQVVEVVAVGRADQLDAALGDRPGRLGLELGPDLVDDDDLGHVVLDRLDHHLVLERRRPDLHPAGLADRRMGDVAVAGDLVRGVDDDDALAEVVGEDAGRLAEHRRLADARPAHDQDRLPALDEVVDDVDRAVDGPPDPAGQPDDLAAPVADRADPVERPLDARPGCRRRTCRCARRRGRCRPR